jgi:putative tryptophan/tyrosine transport system substrate-binding protein
MMRRRDFITLISGATAAWPLAARAQQKIPQVGVLLVEGPELMGPYREALRALGYIEGKTIKARPAAFPSWRRNWSAARSTSSWPR